MKKFIVLGLVAFVAVALATAQTGIALGVRGVVSITADENHLHNDFADYWEDAVQATAKYYGYSGGSADVEVLGKTGGGFALFMRFPLGKIVGIQGEFAYTYNIVEFEKSWEIGGQSGDVTQKLSYHTMSLPILLTFNVIQKDRFFLTPFGGISIAKFLDDSYIDLDGTYVKPNTSMLFGLVLGCSATVNVGKLGIVGDVRANFGFNPIKAGGLELYTPTTLQFSAGLQYML